MFDYELPQGWKWVKVEDVQALEKRATITGPFGSSIGSKFFVPKGVPVIRGNNLTLAADKFIDDGFVFVTEEKAEELKGFTAYPEDVLFTAAGTIGQVGIIPSDCKYDYYIISNKQMRVRFNPSMVDAEFAYYWFSSKPMAAYIKCLDTGSTIPLINLGVLRKLPMPLPPLDEQIKIKKQLVDLDKKIEHNRQINQTLEEMAQAIFKSWFVDFDPVKAKMIIREKGGSEKAQAFAAQAFIAGNVTLEELERMEAGYSGWEELLHPLVVKNFEPMGLDYWEPEHLAATAALFPYALQDSELGEIPEGWSVKNIEEIVSRLKPKKRYTKKQIEKYGKVPVYEQGADILLGFHDDEAGFDASPEAPLFVFGDHTCITYLSCEPFDISQNVIPLSGSLHPTIWVYYAVQGKQEFQEYRRHWSELIINEVVVPDNELPQKFSQLVTTLCEQKECLNAENKSLEQVRDNLLPRLLSGEMSVDAAEDEMEEGI
ncbi:restriction endonuclease subunit S [Mariprofundus ferrooxydans]|uniref:restriction endonuclease subunit S n=1 Tax=Mariprofundus ferrooxydans TaxID=314344 RepID=UPI000373A9D3|nr:restriction endonuclease subunit S [Mariprofundus ferrooxydans]